MIIDRCQPQRLDQFIIHKELAQKVKTSLKEKSFTNLIIHGCEKSGKKTLMNAMIKELTGDLKMSCQTLDKLPIISSQKHMEIFLTKEIKLKCFYDSICTNKVTDEFYIVIHRLDQVSKKYQNILLKYMERNKKIKFICLVTRFNWLTPAFKSRCEVLAVPNPNYDKDLIPFLEEHKLIQKDLKWVWNKERNLFNFLLFLDFINNDVKKSYNETLGLEEKKIRETIQHVLFKKINTFEEFKSKIEESSMKKILKIACEEIFDESKKFLLVNQLTEYDHSTQLGTNYKYHFDAFLAKMLYLLKS